MIKRAFLTVCAIVALSLSVHAQEGKQDRQADAAKPYFASKDLYQVFVLGDSLAAGLWSGVSRTIEGDVRISLNGRYKEDSGLSRPEYYDWNGALPKILASNKIDIAIVMLGSNDAQPIRDGAMRYAFDTPEWRAAYVKQVDELMASLKAAGAAVYWMEMPPVEAEKYDASMKIIAAIHKERAQAAGIRFVETRPELLDNGKYSDSGFDETGEFVRLRSRDGVHFLKEGNNKLGSLVMAAINKDIEVAVAAAPATPPPVAATESQPMPGFGQPSETLPQAAPGANGSEQAPPAKSDYAGALPAPNDPAMAQLARTTKPGTDASRLFSRGEAITARRGRFDDFTPVQ
ncbi:SGNH/GDSL hydrolase family protein [Taklimakanibacter deserti]|uniref:SGNH/GDSL hydrolase family protein n=1 Tax=Taklimakanibacter deserti TaxID=2267839 RepID=UPI000E64667D